MHEAKMPLQLFTLIWDFKMGCEVGHCVLSASWKEMQLSINLSLMCMMKMSEMQQVDGNVSIACPHICCEKLLNNMHGSCTA